jgi:hypothetical protein
MSTIKKKTTVKAVKSRKAAPAVTKTPVTKKPTSKSIKPVKVGAEERMRMVTQAAYFRAEKTGFQGDPQEHWLAAEAEVKALLGDV